MLKQQTKQYKRFRILMQGCLSLMVGIMLLSYAAKQQETLPMIALSAGYIIAFSIGSVLVWLSFRKEKKASAV